MNVVLFLFSQATLKNLNGEVFESYTPLKQIDCTIYIDVLIDTIT